LASLECWERAEQFPLCLYRLDINSFRYDEGVVDLNANIPHRALNLLVPQQNLHCAQVASATLDDFCLSIENISSSSAASDFARTERSPVANMLCAVDATIPIERAIRPCCRGIE